MNEITEYLYESFMLEEIIEKFSYLTNPQRGEHISREQLEIEVYGKNIANVLFNLDRGAYQQLVDEYEGIDSGWQCPDEQEYTDVDSEYEARLADIAVVVTEGYTSGFGDGQNENGGCRYKWWLDFKPAPATNLPELAEQIADALCGGYYTGIATANGTEYQWSINIEVNFSLSGNKPYLSPT
jgi:hypothetical protein